MKKNSFFGKAICIGLVLILSFMIVACGGKTDTDNPSNPDEPTPEPPIEYTEENFFKDGSSEYTLLLSGESGNDSLMIESEFSELFGLMSGCTLETSTDGVKYDENGKYISVGDTEFARTSGITENADRLGETGYRVRTYGKSLIIWGNTEFAALCGMYDVLEKMFGYEAYTVDEIAYTAKTESKLPSLNYEIVPSIDLRIANSWMVAKNRQYASRLRMKIWSEALMSINNQNMATAFALMPKSEYYEDHKDWYNNDASDLCYSSEGMRDQMIENLKKHIAANPEFDKVMIGQEDNCSWCTCSKCKATIAQYGGANVATTVLCVNYIEEKINAWLKEIGDGRTMHFGIFAYQLSKEAPAKYENGAYTPLLKCNPNLFVMYAPIEANYSYSLKATENETYARILDAWKACCDTIYVWSYSTNFNNYMVDFPNWEALADTYRDFKEWGVKMNFAQGPYDMAGMLNVATFGDLRAYLIAKLSFDCTENYQNLIDDFVEHYYKDAAPYISQYLSELRDLHVYNTLYNGLSGSCGFALKQEKFWQKVTLLRWQGYIDDSFKAIEPLKESDPELYETMYWRITKESLSVRFLLIELYSSMFEADELDAMKRSFQSDANHLEIYNCQENTSFSTIYNGWGI